ncbi:MAG: TOBE domain-containing protein [Trueperaceae bacterium]|nr:TOBE domain-containing protein [Trueperaceae bacterium]
MTGKPPIFAHAGRTTTTPENALDALVYDDILQGTDRLLRVQVEGGDALDVRLSSLAYSRLGLRQGARVRVLLKAERLWPLYH